MPRYKLIIEYDGTGFSGWQRQQQNLGVQQVIEEAMQAFCSHEVTLFAAGRTDTGVHASGQVAHVDLPREWPLLTIVRATNHHLAMAGHAVAIRQAEAVGDNFHARFSAQWRQYEYTILNRVAPPALLAGRVWHVPFSLNIENMQAACELLQGYHDFSSFRATYCQSKNPYKTIDMFHVKHCDEKITFCVQSRSFLHHQVRNMVGSIVAVGQGKYPVSWIADVLAARDRTKAGVTAPPQGLVFTEVGY